MGMKRRCVRYKRVDTQRGVELRCKEFVKSGRTKHEKQPECAPGLARGGASPGLVRGLLTKPQRCGRRSKSHSKGKR